MHHDENPPIARDDRDVEESVLEETHEAAVNSLFLPVVAAQVETCSSSDFSEAGAALSYFGIYVCCAVTDLDNSYGETLI